MGFSRVHGPLLIVKFLILLLGPRLSQGIFEVCVGCNTGSCDFPECCCPKDSAPFKLGLEPTQDCRPELICCCPDPGPAASEAPRMKTEFKPEISPSTSEAEHKQPWAQVTTCDPKDRCCCKHLPWIPPNGASSAITESPPTALYFPRRSSSGHPYCSPDHLICCPCPS